MDILRTKKEVRAWIKNNKAQGSTISLVPTMGFFHAGHLALMQKGKKIGDKVIVSLFVNPTQFAKGEDLSTYPADFENDCKLAKSVGVDAIFCPEVNEIYSGETYTKVSLPALSTMLCGKSRPTHFTGVATVVSKLFNICLPDFAVFGEKDFQQLAIIRQMVKDLDIPVKIVSLPTVREESGLAMSSRNTYLSSKEALKALCLSKAIEFARNEVAVGEKISKDLQTKIEEFISADPEVKIDYVAIVNRNTLEERHGIDQDSILVMAIKIGNTRLIDNGVLFVGED